MSRKIYYIGGFFIVLVINVSMHYFPFVQSLNLTALDREFQLLRVWEPKPRDSIAIIGIDQQDLDRYREPLALWHRHLAGVFRALALSSPRAVVVDLILPDKSYDFIQKDLNRELMSSLLILKQKSTLILARTLDSEGKFRPLFAPVVSVLGQDQIGLALIEPDSDQVHRRLLLSINSEQNLTRTLTGVLAAQLNLDSVEGYINYSLGQPYSYTSVKEVLRWREEKDIEALKATFSDKIVFIGSVLPFVDRHLAPAPLADWEKDNINIPGVLIHAQSALTLIDEGTIKSLPHSLLIIFKVLLSLSWFLTYRSLHFFFALLLSFSLLPIASIWFLTLGYFLPVIEFILVVIIALGARTLLELYFSWREKQRMRNSFSRYVSPQVMKDILDHKIRPGVGGSRITICVLFADIRNFTRRSEHEEPEAIIALLNRYFNLFSEAIHDHGGTVDKYIGDGLMAFFGAPNFMDKPAQEAFDASREMLDRLKQLNEQLSKEGIEPIEIGIGLHLGEAVIGHVGSDSRYEYTAIGDTVNISSRLEGLTKQLGYPIVCSESLKSNIETPLIFLGQQSIKGHTPVPVFGWKPDPNSQSN
jgi:adenylate cyclase